MTDAIVILLAGVTFGWTNALYALLVLYASGSRQRRSPKVERYPHRGDYHDQPEAVSRRILDEMERGVTILPGKGAFTGERGRCYTWSFRGLKCRRSRPWSARKTRKHSCHRPGLRSPG